MACFTACHLRARAWSCCRLSVCMGGNHRQSQQQQQQHNHTAAQGMQQCRYVELTARQQHEIAHRLAGIVPQQSMPSVCA